MFEFIKKNKLLIIISSLLICIPFFWLKPGEMDLGGDGNRLYYYDPQTYILHDALFMSDNVIEGIRTFEPHFYHLPYVLLLWGIKMIIPSSYFLISFINGVKLSLSFLSVYFIIRTILHNSYKERGGSFWHIPSFLGGLFYITSPMMIGNYDKALISQNQVFLNPLLFYLLLVYFLSQKFRYLAIAVILSVIFTPNFSWVSAPPFFAFFPLASLFLLIYTVTILNKRVIFSHLLAGFLLFVGLHAFHLIPEIFSLLSPGSYVNERVFSKTNILQQLNYFYGVLPNSKLSVNILMNAPFKAIGWSSVIPAFFIIVGFVLNKSKNKTFLLSGIFFLISLYLVTANITKLGVKLYENLFYIPGFSMFRNFIGQWGFVFSFFYALLFGQAVYLVYRKIRKPSYRIITAVIMSILFIAGAWTFFTGALVNKTHFQSKNVKIAMTMDPDYEKTLTYIKSLKNDGAIISFPFTDCCYSVVHGVNNGAYVGTSPIAGLTGRKDYNGYTIISPFGEVFLRLAKNKDYESINKLLGLLNVQYIFYNADPRAYDSTFPGYPYSTVRNFLPSTQKEYVEFIDGLKPKKVYEEGAYQLYEVNDKYTLSHFYTPESTIFYKNDKDDWYGKTKSFFIEHDSIKPIYIDQESCFVLFSADECSMKIRSFKENPQIFFEKINPTKYLVHVKAAKNEYMLAFSETYDDQWDIYLSGNTNQNFIPDLTQKKIPSERQIQANGYANAWHIKPTDVNNLSDYTLTVEMTKQRVFYISFLISVLTLAFGIIGGVFFLFRR